MTMELETINKLFLELSQFATAKTARELKLEKEVAEKEQRVATALSALHHWERSAVEWCERAEGLQSRVAELGREAQCAAIMSVCGYFSRMRGPDAWRRADAEIAGWMYHENVPRWLLDVEPAFEPLYAGSAPVPAAQAIDASAALSVLSKAMQSDADFAWSWHCNIAMTAQDAGALPASANIWAANFMRRAFDVDTLSRVNAMPATQADAIAAALRARAVPTHNLTGHDVDDIARVLCWLKNGDTPPAAQIERIVHRNAELRGIVDDMRARAVPDEPVESILAAYKTGISHGKEQTNHEFEFAPGSASDKAYTTGYNEGYEQRLAMLAASKGAKQ